MAKSTVLNILEKHNAYTPDLELELLRHFDRLRLEMLNYTPPPTPPPTVPGTTPGIENDIVS